ncbi:MAG: hypothetical protein K9G59_17625 [Caulobacter sp.]|nr:hypothetical protein [Caulobacter sp.]
MNEMSESALLEATRNGLQATYMGVQHLLQVQVITLWEAIKAEERRRDPHTLVAHGFRVFSQNDEDGILAEIFRRIGTTNRHFVEIGATENTLFLLLQGWQGCRAGKDCGPTPTAIFSTMRPGATRRNCEAAS